MSAGRISLDAVRELAATRASVDTPTQWGAPRRPRRPVTPYDHALSCRRGLTSSGPTSSFDRHRCERCRHLHRRLEAVTRLRRMRQRATA